MKSEWAGKLWQRFKDLYGHKWASMFQGPESIESWRLTWAEINADADQLRYALARLPKDYPDWPPTFGQFQLLCRDCPRPQLPQPALIEHVKPSQETIKKLEQTAEKIARKSKLPYWTVDVVENDQQVNFIVLQANRFGPNSEAGKFLVACKAAGVITEDNRLGGVKQ